VHSHLNDIILPKLAFYFGPGYSERDCSFSLTVEDSKHDKRNYLIIVATVPSSPSSPSSTFTSSPSPHESTQIKPYHKPTPSPATGSTTVRSALQNKLPMNLRTACVGIRIMSGLVALRCMSLCAISWFSRRWRRDEKVDASCEG
jgi:hypothetical protein